MATLPSLLPSKSSHTLHAFSSLRTFNVSENALFHNTPPQCSLHSHVQMPLATDIPCPATSRALEIVPAPEKLGFIGLDGRAGCLLGLGAVAGTMMAFPQHATAAEMASNLDAWSSLVASEPKNALSLPTWVIHVASVAEWITAMALVWRYGDTPGNSTWKGLSWGMVPLLGGAMCACTWHFFYNAQSLEILVVLQAALTVIGNFTMWIAAFRIYQSSQKQSKIP